MKRLLFALLISVLTATAAPLERDLGQGLIYYRVHQLPSDLPATPAKKGQAIIIDLRYAKGDDSCATALDAWLKFHASATAPVFLLVNATTAPELTLAFAQRSSAAGLLAIGTPSPNFSPDIVVNTTPETERRAYDALEHGSDAAALLTDKPVKPRHDEAELARLRQIPATDTSVDDDPPPPAKPTPPAPPPSLIDSALQRAVQMHRALLALRKLPAG